MPSKAARCSLAIAAYWGALGLFAMTQNAGAMPAWLEAPFSAFCAPGVLLLGALAKPLAAWGLAEGEAILLPTPPVRWALMGASCAAPWLFKSLRSTR